MKKTKTEKEFFEFLYTEYEQKIFSCAYSILRQKEQAEDVTQDVFEKLYENNYYQKNLDSLHLKKLILTITKNKAIDLYRKNNTQISYIDNYREADTKVNNVETHFNQLVSEEEFVTISSHLKEPYLQVFIYRIFYGLSAKEISTITDTKEATIRKQFERAKNKIKEIIGGNQHEEAK